MHAFSLVPLAVLDVSAARVIDAESVLLSVFPAAIVLARVGPCEHTVSFLFIIDVFTLVLPAIRPSEDACAVHLVALPLTIVLAAI